MLMIRPMTHLMVLPGVRQKMGTMKLLLLMASSGRFTAKMKSGRERCILLVFHPVAGDGTQSKIKVLFSASTFKYTVPFLVFNQVDLDIVGEVFLTFNWNPAKQRAAMEKNGGQAKHIFPMMYPNAKNTPFLTGTVGALGVNAAKDQKQKDAAMSFVRYLMTDEDMYRDAVLLSGCFPARHRLNGRNLDGLYGDDQTMQLYETFNEYYGTYEPTMELYSGLDQAWPQFLRDLADGAKIKAATEDLEEELNEKLEEEYGIKPIEMDEEA